MNEITKTNREGYRKTGNKTFTTESVDRMMTNARFILDVTDFGLEVGAICEEEMEFIRDAVIETITVLNSPLRTNLIYPTNTEADATNTGSKEYPELNLNTDNYTPIGDATVFARPTFLNQAIKFVGSCKERFRRILFSKKEGK